MQTLTELQEKIIVFYSGSMNLPKDDLPRPAKAHSYTSNILKVQEKGTKQVCLKMPMLHTHTK
jgi:hypothetical protein